MADRLHWCWQPTEDQALGEVLHLRSGLSIDQKNHQVVVDFRGGALKERPAIPSRMLDLVSDKGQGQNATVQPMPGDAWRLSFQLTTGSEKVFEMHARLLNAGKPISDTWIYRWTS